MERKNNKNSNATRQTQQQTNNQNGGTTKNSSPSDGPSFTKQLKTPPPPGSPETKIFTGETTERHWCAECGRWSKTHGTATHTGKKRNAANTSEAQSQQPQQSSNTQLTFAEQISNQLRQGRS